MKNKLQFISIVLLTSLLVACGDDGVKVNAKFANTQDIEEGTSVFFEEKQIGKVQDVSRTEHGSVVLMSFEKELAAQINERAAVVVDRLGEGVSLEVHNPPGPVKQAVQDGQSIQGLDSMMQLLQWGIGSTFDSGAQSMEAFKEYLQSDQFTNDKAKMGDAIDQGVQAAKESLKEAEVAIEEAINEISISEEELASVVEELGEGVAPVVEELAQSGAELMVELERFAQNLESSTEQNQQTGEQFMKSLTEALETLNKSFNEGIDEGLNTAPADTDTETEPVTDE